MSHKLLFLILILNSSFVFSQNTVFNKGENWTISKGIIQPIGSDKDALSAKYWLYLNKVLPNRLLQKYIVSLRLFTDGLANDMGGISPLNKENTHWEFDIDTTDFNFENTHSVHITSYTHTIIHEFGHLLTLNPNQVESTNEIIQDDSKGYLTSEGYAKNNSYLGRFVSLFWEGELLSEWDRIQKIENNYKRADLLYKLYLKNKDDFLTDYAAKSPEEDIAESWTFFILNDKPSPNKIKHQKVLFFYDCPELVTYRKNIRKNLGHIPVDYINNYQFNRDQIISNKSKRR